jgi:type VI secretion system protein VasD
VLELTLKGGADQNPDASGKAASVAVHVYQLVSTAKFDRADVFALTEREAATLGADELGSEEVLLGVGETQTLTHELKKGTDSIGIAVLFRDIDHAKWRASAKVKDSGTTKLTLTVSGLTATLAPQATLAPP